MHDGIRYTLTGIAGAALIVVALIGLHDHTIDDLTGWWVAALWVLVVAAPAAGAAWVWPQPGRHRNP